MQSDLSPFSFTASGTVVLTKLFPTTRLKRNTPLFQHLYASILKIYSLSPFRVYSRIGCDIWIWFFLFPRDYSVVSASHIRKYPSVYPSDPRCHPLSYTTFLGVLGSNSLHLYQKNLWRRRSAWPWWHITKSSHNFIPLVCPSMCQDHTALRVQALMLHWLGELPVLLQFFPGCS